MDRESIKEAFFQLKTRDDVASILGISERSLRYFLYKIRPENMYHTFKVPKKDGATREIAAPEKRLKKIQRKLADVLSAVYSGDRKYKNAQQGVLWDAGPIFF